MVYVGVYATFNTFVGLDPTHSTRPISFAWWPIIW